MKALVYEKAHTLDKFAIVLADIAEPVLRENDVLVEVRAIGINPGEASIRKMRSAEPGGRVLLGWEFAGVIVSMGTAVQHFRVGDRVFGTGDMSRDGCWAERVAVDHRILAGIPDQLSFADAASLPIGALTAWEAMFRDQTTLPESVEKVLVLGGAGGVGSIATQLLKATTKAFVISTGSREESREWCKKMGADLVLDHTGNVIEQLAANGLTDLDMVLSTAKTADNLGWITKSLRPFGHLAFTDGLPSLDVSSLMMKSLSLHTEMVFSRIMNDSAPRTQGLILDAVATFVVDGRIKPITTKRLAGLTAETMQTAHWNVETGHTIGKVVIEV